MITKNREKQTEMVRNQTVNALSVQAILLSSAGTPTTADIDFEQIIVKLVLNRGGVQDIIMQDDLKTLGIASTLDSLTQIAFDGVGKTINTGLGVAVLFTVPFGGHINLKGDDFIFVEVQSLRDAYSSTAISATSYVETKLVKSVGYETHIPKIQSIAVQTNESTRKYDIGDNIKRVAILNYDKTSFANNVIQNITISSDRYNENLSFLDLVHSKMLRYPKSLNPTSVDVSDQMIQDQSFVLMDFHQEFKGVELDIKFNSSQVTQGNNKIVWWTYRTDSEIINKAIALESKHIQKATDAIALASKK